MIVMTPRLPGLLAAALAIATVSACGTSGGQASDSGADKLDVVAAFYPLEYVTTQIGGSRVSVTGLTKPGGEPHDLELAPKQVASVARADLVVYESGFQPTVDAAVKSEGHDNVLDVTPSAQLTLHGNAEHEEGDGHSADDGHDHEGVDPHFWLDPLRYADVGDAVAKALAAKDPGGATAYTEGASAFRAQMEALDKDYKTGLAHCETKELVTSHAAFGYLAERYGLHQEGITGLDPEGEPDPATLARIVAHVRASGATTIYAEVLVSPDVARTIARETGAEVAVLDPIEGITTESAGTDYPSVMRSNLTTLESGQRCT
jgi:zinc transport system substrate-binding protein